MTFTRAELEHFAAKERDRFEDLLQRLRRGAERLRRPGAQAGPRARGRARCRDASGASAARPTCTACRAAARSCWAVRQRARRSHGHRLQPSRRAARVSQETEPWRTRALHVHEGRRHLPTAAAPPTTRGRRSRRSSARGGARGGRAGEHPLPVGDSRRRSARRTSRHTLKKIGSAARTDVGRGLGHGVGLARPALALDRPARPAALHLPPGDRGDRPALRDDRRRRAQPDRRALPARVRDLRRAHRPREDPRLLRRRGAAVRREIADFKAAGFSVHGLHEGPRLQVHPHARPARGDEAHLGDADLRDPRPRRRVHAARA